MCFGGRIGIVDSPAAPIMKNNFQKFSVGFVAVQLKVVASIFAYLTGLPGFYSILIYSYYSFTFQNIWILALIWNIALTLFI